MSGNEAKSRIKINKLLEESGWRLLDDENGQATVLTKRTINLEYHKNNNTWGFTH